MITNTTEPKFKTKQSMKSKQFNIKAVSFLLLLFVFAFGNLYGQQTITGTVTDETGPLPGVTIVEKGTSNGTTSDFDGNFTISVADENSILVFSYLGFITQEVSARLRLLQYSDGFRRR